MREQFAKAGVPDDAFSEHEVQIPGRVIDAQAATQARLAQHPSDDNLVIWTTWSDAAVGALAALNQAGRSVPICPWDLTKQADAPLQDGTFEATSLSDPDGLAEQLVTMISDYLAGVTPSDLTHQPSCWMLRTSTTTSSNTPTLLSSA